MSELLRSPQATVRDAEIVQGKSCWRVEFGNIEKEDKPPRELTVWLDPQNDYSLVKAFVRPVGMAEEDIGEKEIRNFVITETRRFQVVKDEPQSEDRQLPLEAVLIGPGGRMRYDFASIRMNHKIDRSRFIPRPQIGTEMVVRAAGKPEVKMIHGGPAAARPPRAARRPVKP